jgi:hypothetical protein
MNTLAITRPAVFAVAAGSIGVSGAGLVSSSEPRK